MCKAFLKPIQSDERGCRMDDDWIRQRCKEKKAHLLPGIEVIDVESREPGLCTTATCQEQSIDIADTTTSEDLNLISLQSLS